MNQDFVLSRDHNVNVYFSSSVCWLMCKEFGAFMVIFVGSTPTVCNLYIIYLVLSSLPLCTLLNCPVGGKRVPFKHINIIHKTTMSEAPLLVFRDGIVTITVAQLHPIIPYDWTYWQLAEFRPIRKLRLTLASGWTYHPALRRICVVCKCYGNHPVTLCSVNVNRKCHGNSAMREFCSSRSWSHLKLHLHWIWNQI